MNMFTSSSKAGRGGNPEGRVNFNQAFGLFSHVSKLPNEVLERDYKAKPTETGVLIKIGKRDVHIEKSHPFQSIVDSGLTNAEYSAWREKNPYTPTAKSSGKRWSR